MTHPNDLPHSNGSFANGYPSNGHAVDPRSVPQGVDPFQQSLPSAHHPGHPNGNGNGHGYATSNGPTLLSVSPSRPGTPIAPAWAHGSLGNGAANGHPGEVHPDLRLGALVARADGSIGDLERLARTVLDTTSAANQASGDLQERLRLGVRMLQAFDVQIQRSEASHQQLTQQIGQQLLPFLQNQLQAHLSGQLAAASQQMELRMNATVEALERRIADAVPFLDERLRSAQEQMTRGAEERLAAAERRIDERLVPATEDLRRYVDETASAFAARLDAILREKLEHAPASVPEPPPPVDLGHLAKLEERLSGLIAEADRRTDAIAAALAQAEERMQHLVRHSADAADALLGTVGTATTLKDLILDETRETRRIADEAQSTTRELETGLVELIERCVTMRGSLGEDLDRYTTATRSIDQRSAAVQALRTELEVLASRLQPWESLVRRDGAPAPHVVDAIANTVRQSMADDMRNFSSALRQLASRAEHSFASGRFDEFSAVVDAASTANPAPTIAPVPAADAKSRPEPATTTTALPIETRRLTAEILALDATSLLRPPATI